MWRGVRSLLCHSSEIGQEPQWDASQNGWMTAAASGQRERVVQQMPTALPRGTLESRRILNKVFLGPHI